MKGCVTLDVVSGLIEGQWTHRGLEYSLCWSFRWYSTLVRLTWGATKQLKIHLSSLVHIYPQLSHQTSAIRSK